MEHDEEFETFCQKLKEYPSYFQLNLNKLNICRWTKVKRKIISERAEISHIQCDLEIYRDLNLEAFANFELGNFGESENLINKVIDKSQNRNMNACAMMAMIKYRNGEFSESERYMQHLCQLGRFKSGVNESRAEIAYACSRLGASYYENAISIFEQLMPENQKQFIWKYGLALTFRRCLHLSVRSMMSNMDTKSYYKKAEDIFLSIINKYPCADDVLRLYVARSYIELANLYSMSCIDGEHVNRHHITQLINKSIRIQPNNHTILCKAGKLFRNFSKYNLARKYLEKANSIRRTSLSCHHLGLVRRGQIKTVRHGGHHHGFRPREFNCATFQSYSSPFFEPPRNMSPNIINTQNRSHDISCQTLTSPYITSSQDIEEDCAPVNRLGNSFLSNCHGDISTSDQPVAHHSTHRKMPFDQNDASYESSGDHMSNISMEYGKLEIETKPKDLKGKGMFKVDTNVLENKVDYGDVHLGQLQVSAENPSADICRNVSGSKLSPYAAEFVPRSINSNIYPSKEQASDPMPANDLQLREAPQLDTQKTYECLVKRILKSPQKIAIYPASATKELELCIKLFQEAVDISEGHNQEAQYDIGLTYLQLAEPRYQLALDKFRIIFNNDKSPFIVFKSYEQSGLCLLHMSNNSRYSADKAMDYKQDAKEMFKRAIRCWSLCQKASLNNSIANNTDQYCQSLISFRDLILGVGETDINVKGITDLAKLYSTVRKYGESLDLYETLWVKLTACGQDESCEVMQGVITNSIELGRYDAALDMLAVFVLTKEGVESKRFISEVLIKTMEHAVDHSNGDIAKRVFTFHNPNHTVDNIMIIFDEEGELSTHRGNLMGGWLKEFCRHGLSVTQNSDNVPLGRPKLYDTAERVADCEMVIFVVSNEHVHEYMMDIALNSKFGNAERRLSKILSVSIDGSPVPVQLRPCKSMTLPGDDQESDRKVFLKEVCKLYLGAS